MRLVLTWDACLKGFVNKDIPCFRWGAGYIASYTTLSLLQAGLDLVVLDNLSNILVESLSRV